MYFSILWQRHLNFKEEIIELYSARILRAFAYSLIGVFIPVYLLNLGFSFQQVIIFLLVKYFVLGISAPFIGLFQKKEGLKHTIILSTFILAVFLLMLYSIKTYNWNLVLLGAITGLELSFFWIPMNSDFSIHMKKESTGSQTSLLVVLPRVVTVISPFLGALIITYYSFNVLLIIAILIVLATAFPLTLTKDKHYQILPILDIFSKHNRKYTSIFLAKGILSSATLLWPLFLYFTSNNYIFIGGLSTLKAVAGAFIGLVIGKFSDKNPQTVFKKVSLFSSLIWFTTIFISGALLVSIYSFLIGLAFVSFCIPTFAFICKDSYHDHMVELMIYREVVLSISRIFIFASAFILPIAIVFKVIFLIAAIASFSLVFFKAN